MRKRLTLLLVMTLVAVGMALPASAAAAEGNDYKVIYNYCSGANPMFKVKNIARGWSNANKLTNETWVERRPGTGGPWTRVYEWDISQYKFDANGDKHWLTSWRTWQGNRYNWFRIGFRVRAWNGQNMLSSATIYSRKC